MPATVIAERVEWTGSITWFREHVRRLRPEHRPVDPADRLTWSAGDAAQCDLWCPPRKIPLEDGTTSLLPVDFNTQLQDWLQIANAREVRTIKARPVDLIDHDRSRMLALPPIPLQLGWRERTRLGRDYYVRLAASDYSVDPTVIGRLVDVSTDLDRVRVRLDGRVVADHARAWARGRTVTDPAHVETAKLLRHHFQQPRLVPAGDDLARDLADYDRAFGIEGVA